MKRILGLALFAAVAAAPVVVEAQVPRAGQEQAARTWDRGLSAQRLQQLRAELNLSDAQVSRLQAIHQRVREQNAPLMEQLRASGAWQGKDGEARQRSGERRAATPEQREQLRERARNRTPEQREALRRQMQERRQSAQPGEQGQRARAGRQVPEELRPVVQQIRANSRAGMAEARAVLSTEQQAQLRQIVQQQRAEFQRRGAQGRGLRSGR